MEVLVLQIYTTKASKVVHVFCVSSHVTVGIANVDVDKFSSNLIINSDELRSVRATIYLRDEVLADDVV